jgi:hypothetical protein
MPPHIINAVWGKNDNAHLALGGPHGNLSLIRRHLLFLSKIAINTIYIWTTDPELPVLDPKPQSFKYLPPTLQTILLHSCEKLTYACKPVPSGAASTKLLTNNSKPTLFLTTQPLKTKVSSGFATSYSTMINWMI